MKIYFAGSIRGGRDNQKFSERAIQEISKYAMVLTEHVGDPNLSVNGENKTESYIYDRDMDWLKEADAIVAEVTTASLGVGYEIAYAEMWGKPVLCLFNTDFNKGKLSAMIMGAAAGENDLISIAYYNEVAELEKIIREFFLSLSK